MSKYSTEELVSYLHRAWMGKLSNVQEEYEMHEAITTKIKVGDKLCEAAKLILESTPFDFKVFRKAIAECEGKQ